ncbi:M1 family metallopeptidase [Cellulomonas hominis]
MTVPSADPYLPRRGDTSVEVTRYELELDYRVTGNHLRGAARLHLVVVHPLTRFALDLVGMRVSSVLVGGARPRRWEHRGGRLAVWPRSPVEPGATLVVDVEYAGQPRPLVGTWGEVGWEELTDGVIVAGQPDGAPSWFPCNDRPDDKASYRIAVTTEQAYQVLANGALVDRRVRSSRVRWVFEQPEPMATYLATVQIGRYERLDLPGDDVPLHAAVPARLRPAFLHDFARQPQMMAAFTEMFGPYPFAQYTVVVTDDPLEIPLEAQGMSVFGANHVDGRRGSERLVAHELAHQWFGNSLTLRHWRDIWLHEGFACYAEWLWSQRSGGRSAAACARAAWARLAAQPQDLLVGDPGPADMFDDRVYKRGALALHAVRVALGDEAFFAALRDWTGAWRHGTVDTAAFVACVARHLPVGDGGAARAAATDQADRTDPAERLLRPWLHERPLPPFPTAPAATPSATPSTDQPPTRAPRGLRPALLRRARGHRS